MPYYVHLRDLSARDRRRTIDGLLSLRTRLSQELPRRNLTKTLLIGTWNIREFDSSKYGARCEESYYYLAEIISHFDLVAVQEIRADLTALKKLMSVLGRSWRYMVTDVTLGGSGNEERLAFVYDERKVRFTGLVGELVLPKPKRGQVLQFARTPFMCQFQAGWSPFTICTVHIYYGKAVKNDPRRVKEIGDLVNTLAAIAKGKPRPVKSSVGGRAEDRSMGGENLVLLGDFNIFNVNDVTFSKLVEAGFAISKKLQGGVGTNLKRDKHYDQIAFMPVTDRFESTGEAGVFDFSTCVFGPGAEGLSRYGSLIDKKYFKTKTGKKKDPVRVYNDWRTYQMSDHLLLWAEIKTDFTDHYLEDLKAGDFTAIQRTRKIRSVGPPSARPREIK